MKKQKLYNIIRKDIDTFYDDSWSIKRQKFSFKFLKALFDACELDSWWINLYCCYGEDHSCWADENVCWWSGSLKNNPIRQYYYVRNYINSILTPEQIKKWNIYIIENNESIVLNMPMRFAAKEDTQLVFKKIK